MAWILLAVLATARDAAPAGAEYLRGLKHLQGEQYDDAVRALEAAITFEPNEAEVLKYRDARGRHRHPYFPYYWLARAYVGSARRVSSLDVKRQHLSIALRHIDSTLHANSDALRSEAETALKKVEKAIEERDASVLPPEVAPLRAKALSLCDQERFEEALREIEAASDLFARQPRAKQVLINTVRNRQRLVLQRYRDVMTARLESISRTDPTLEAETVLPLLRPACVPAEVEGDPAAEFKWLLEFFAHYEKEIDRVRAAAELPHEELLGSALSFEKAAERALQLGVFGGYRAARNMAHCLRMARLKKHVSEGDPSKEEYRDTAETIINNGGWARTQSEAALSKLVAGEEKPPFESGIKRYVATDLAYQTRQLDDQKARMEREILNYARRVAAEKQVADALGGLARPDRMSDPVALRKIQQELSALESKSHFETLPAKVRAQVIFTRAVSTAVAAYLDGETDFQVAERCSSDVTRAYTLDPDVDKGWDGRLSPRIKQVFEDLLTQ